MTTCNTLRTNCSSVRVAVTSSGIRRHAAKLLAEHAKHFELCVGRELIAAGYGLKREFDQRRRGPLAQHRGDMRVIEQRIVAGNGVDGGVQRFK